MIKIVQGLKEQRRFGKELETQREKVQGNEAEKVDEDRLAFDRRIYRSNRNVVLPISVRRILAKNEENRDCMAEEYCLTRNEMDTMSELIDKLELLHRDRSEVRYVLSHTLTLLERPEFDYIRHAEEDGLEHEACYYILHGRVEVTYELDLENDSINAYKPHSVYTHGAKEYLGLLCAGVQENDLTTPTTIYTLAPSVLLRVGRDRFHQFHEDYERKLGVEKSGFVRSVPRLFEDLKEHHAEAVIRAFTKVEFRAKTAIVQQGEVPTFFYMVASGRCRCQRSVTVNETGGKTTVQITLLSRGDVFNESVALADGEPPPSKYEVIACIDTVCYGITRLQMDTPGFATFRERIQDLRPVIPSDIELKQIGYRSAAWQRFKHDHVRSIIKAKGHDWLLAEKPEVQLSGPVGPQSQTRLESKLEARRQSYYDFLAMGSRFQTEKQKQEAASALLNVRGRRNAEPFRAEQVLKTRYSAMSRKSVGNLESSLQSFILSQRNKQRPLSAAVMSARRPSQSEREKKEKKEKAPKSAVEKLLQRRRTTVTFQNMKLDLSAIPDVDEERSDESEEEKTPQPTADLGGAFFGDTTGGVAARSGGGAGSGPRTPGSQDWGLSPLHAARHNASEHIAYNRLRCQFLQMHLDRLRRVRTKDVKKREWTKLTPEMIATAKAEAEKAMRDAAYSARIAQRMAFRWDKHAGGKLGLAQQDPDPPPQMSALVQKTAGPTPERTADSPAT